MATRRLNDYDRADLDQFVNDVCDEVACGQLEEPLSIGDLFEWFEMTRSNGGDRDAVTSSQMRSAIRRALRDLKLKQ